jgi:hypothetical protein
MTEDPNISYKVGKLLLNFEHEWTFKVVRLEEIMLTRQQVNECRDLLPASSVGPKEDYSMINLSNTPLLKIEGSKEKGLLI